jgi:hypothetical protein
MQDEITDRVARFERALVAIAAHKPAGALMTNEDEDRAAWVADAVSRYEDRQKLARVKLPSPAVVMAGAPEEVPAKRPRRPRRYRSRKGATAAPETTARPRRGGRPRKTPPAAPEG